MKTRRLCGRKKKRENRKFTEWNGHSWSEGGKCKIHYATGERDETLEHEDRRKNTESASKEVRDSQQSVLSRSPLRGTSMQDETRMHVSVRRSTSSKEENEAKVK